MVLMYYHFRNPPSGHESKDDSKRVPAGGVTLDIHGYPGSVLMEMLIHVRYHTTLYMLYASICR